MKLSEWISAEGGRVAVAKKLGITPTAIHYWLKREITPTAKLMAKIVKLSGGGVSYAEMIEETKPGLKRKARK